MFLKTDFKLFTNYINTSSLKKSIEIIHQHTVQPLWLWFSVSKLVKLIQQYYFFINRTAIFFFSFNNAKVANYYFFQYGMLYKNQKSNIQ